MHTPRFVLASIAGAALILSAPFLGEIRRTLRSTFPAQYLLILGSVLALVIAAAVMAALVRIRNRRAFRYGAIAAALGLGTVYSLSTAGSDPQVNAVERFHFVEYGIVTLLFYRAWRPLEDASVVVLPVLAGLLVATLEEWFQWFIPARVGEMRDVLLSGAAIACGVLFSLGVDPPSRVALALRPDSLKRIGAVAGVAVVVFAAFVHSVHFGYAVTDPAAGTFYSRYDAATLEALARDRSVRWKAEPPPVSPPRVSREDQYRTEGIQHVARRNTTWDGGDALSAWRENQILERYYAPVLDTGHRWPPAQREDAKRRVAAASKGAAADGYVSSAYPYPIYTWPRPLFWTFVLAAVCAMLVATRRGSG